MSDNGRALPEFAAARTEVEQYAVERQPRPDHDGERIRIRALSGAPAMMTVLDIIRHANAEGWLLDKNDRSADELVFVAVEGGESQ